MYLHAAAEMSTDSPTGRAVKRFVVTQLWAKAWRTMRDPRERFCLGVLEGRSRISVSLFPHSSLRKSAMPPLFSFARAVSACVAALLLTMRPGCSPRRSRRTETTIEYQAPRSRKCGNSMLPVDQFIVAALLIAAIYACNLQFTHATLLLLTLVRYRVAAQ